MASATLMSASVAGCYRIKQAVEDGNCNVEENGANCLSRDRKGWIASVG